MAMESVFENSLIVSHICSFVSVDDLLNLRLTSPSLCREATVYLRRRNATVKLDSDLSVNKFLQTMENRMGAVLPFTSFSLNVYQMSHERVRDLMKTIAQHVTCYKLSCRKKPCTGRNLGILLANVPNLKEIWIETDEDIHLNRRDAGLISPWMPNLRIIRIFNSNRQYPPTSFARLTSLLVSRSAQISYFQVETGCYDVQDSDLDSFRGLTPNQLPKSVSISNDRFLFLINRTLPLLDDLVGMKLCFERLDLRIKMDRLAGNQRLVSQLWEWLSLQSDHLEKLDLSSWSPTHGSSIRLPTLRALTKLSFNFNNLDLESFEDDEDEIAQAYRDFNPILPFVNNQFPSLAELKLIDFNVRGYAAFSEIRMPSMRKLTILYNEYYLGGMLLFPDTLPLILPNLHSLHLHLNFNLYSGLDFNPLLSGILTRLAYVTELKLLITMDAASNSNSFWDIFTAGAPRLAQVGEALSGDLGPEVAAVPVPMDRIYEKPSLANLRNLKTFVFQSVHPENMDALVYMTRCKLLVPLEKLVIIPIYMDIAPGYIEALAGYHGVVEVQEWDMDMDMDT